MNDTQTSSVYTLGRALEERLMATLDAQPLKQFDSLLALKNLAGESTGYLKSFAGERIAKGTSVSINMMPGARYFNIHIVPEPQYDVPRFFVRRYADAQGKPGIHGPVSRFRCRGGVVLQ